jgi:Spy/CpxP family protein refolding chaperone
MFGFLIGTISLIALVKVVRSGRGWGRHGGGPRRWMLRRLFQRLDTTPGQEKVILEAVDALEQNGREAKDAFLRSRSDFARAMTGEHFETATVNEAFEKQQAGLDAMKKAALEAMQKIHEALNPEQRKQAAQLIEFGPRGLHGGGCGGPGGGCHGEGRYGRYTSSQPGAVNL